MYIPIINMSMTPLCIIGIIFGTAMVSGENILSKVIQLYKIDHGLVLFFGSSISGKKKKNSSNNLARKF